jgi:MFS family permease
MGTRRFAHVVPVAPVLPREVVRAAVGAMLVFYSVTVIAYSLPFVGRTLFESTDEVQVALNTLGLVAGGYLAKPLAQAVTGRYADLHGRKPVLVAAGLLAAASALLLAVLPTVDTIGVAAPILFTAATALGAAAAGAEWPLLAAYVAESTPVQRRGFVTSVASFFVCLGWLLAVLVPLLLHGVLSDAEYADWGWRVALLPAVALGLLSVALRRGLPESPGFLSLRASGALQRSPMRALFAHQARTWLAMVLHIGMISACFFLTVAYPVVFVALADKFTPVEALVVGGTALAFLVAGICVGGTLGDRFGPRPVSAAGFILTAALAFPAYALMSTGDLVAALVGAAAVGAALSLSAGVYEAWMVSSFRTRWTGSATTCNGVAIAAFGTPALWLAAHIARDHGHLAPAGLLVAAGALGALSTGLLRPSIHDRLD